MRQQMRSALWFGPIILIGALGIIYFALQMPNTQKKNTAPDFTLTTLDGRKITLSKLRGKPVFLNFWSSW